jgi:hypothetical protein
VEIIGRAFFLDAPDFLKVHQIGSVGRFSQEVAREVALGKTTISRRV